MILYVYLFDRLLKNMLWSHCSLSCAGVALVVVTVELVVLLDALIVYLVSS